MKIRPIKDCEMANIGDEGDEEDEEEEEGEGEASR